MSDRHDEELARMARRDYNSPPPAPREEMWAAIESRLETAGDELSRRRERRADRAGWSAGRWIGLAVAASAVLALGVSLGRVTAPSGAPDVVTLDGTPAATPLIRTVAADHLASTESLLAFVQTDARTGRFDRAVGEWGDRLLVETRMLLDSEVGDDPALRELLLDLELILAQVAVLSAADDGERGREELRLIARGVEAQDMMTRLRTALPPAEPGLSGT